MRPKGDQGFFLEKARPIIEGKGRIGEFFLNREDGRLGIRTEVRDIARRALVYLTCLPKRGIWNYRLFSYWYTPNIPKEFRNQGQFSEVIRVEDKPSSVWRFIRNKSFLPGTGLVSATYRISALLLI